MLCGRRRRIVIACRSKHLVVFTGAGISTSYGIPDFRGPKGIWTLQRQGKALPEASLPFHRATPSTTHMALVEFEKAGILKFLISQACLMPPMIIMLMASIFVLEYRGKNFLNYMETPSWNNAHPAELSRYVGDFEIETIGLKETTRRCSKAACGTKLRDTVLDWEV